MPRDFDYSRRKFSYGRAAWGQREVPGGSGRALRDTTALKGTLWRTPLVAMGLGALVLAPAGAWAAGQGGQVVLPTGNKIVAGSGTGKIAIQEFGPSNHNTMLVQSDTVTLANTDKGQVIAITLEGIDVQGHNLVVDGDHIALTLPSRSIVGTLQGTVTLEPFTPSESIFVGGDPVEFTAGTPNTMGVNDTTLAMFATNTQTIGQLFIGRLDGSGDALVSETGAGSTLTLPVGTTIRMPNGFGFINNAIRVFQTGSIAQNVVNTGLNSTMEFGPGDFQMVVSTGQLSGGSNTNVSVVTQSGIIGLYGIWDLHQPITTLDTTNGAPVRTVPGNDINAGGFSSTGSSENNALFINAGLLGNVNLFGPSGVPTPAVPGVFGPGPFSAVLKQPEEFRLGPVTIYGNNITFGVDPDPDHYDPDHAFHAGDVTVFAEGGVIGSIDVDHLHFFGSSANMWGFVEGQDGIGAAIAIDVIQENPPGPFLMNGFPFPVNFLGVQFGIDAILELLDKNLPDGGLPNSGLGSITQWDGAHYGKDNYEPYNVEFCRAAFNLSYEQGWSANSAFIDVRKWLIHEGGTGDPCFPPKQP